MGNMDDLLVLDREYKRGDRNKKVKLIQEWLCFHGIGVIIDKHFGPATEYAVKAFQEREGMEETGIVDRATFERLIGPMNNALKPIETNGSTLGEMVIAYAKQQFEQHPIEVGGDNLGPWVRLYMNGNETKWCAAFACFVLRQACESLGVALPIRISDSCTALAWRAKEKGIFLSESDAKDRSKITPGSLFLNKEGDEWHHTGIVIQIESEIFITIEGNAHYEVENINSRSFEVCQKVNGYNNRDFLII